MTTAGVKSQWTKRLQLQRFLPENVAAELKDLLRKDESEAGATPYKTLKVRILETFGPRPEDRYRKAKELVLTGRPSQLCKQLIDILCEKDLTGCCCEGIISGMWRDQLPREVRAAVANLSIAKTHLEATLRHADAVYASLQLPAPSVAALDVPDQDQVAGIRQNPAKSQKNRRQSTSQQKGAGSGPKPRGRGDPHPDGPPETSCSLHWRWGRGAYYCKDEENCPWKDQCKPPKDKKKK